MINTLNRFNGLITLQKKIAVAFLLVSGLLQVVKAQVGSTTLFPVADTWVRSTGSDKDINYGSDTTFMTRHSSAGYIEIAFLKFNLGGFTLPAGGVIDSAKLFMTMVFNQSSGGVVNILAMSDTSDNWDENAITWNSGRPDTVHGIAPIASVAVNRLNPEVGSNNGNSYNWNITSQVLSELSSGNKLLSVAVYPDYKTDVNIKFLSRQSALTNLRPQLVIYTHTDNPNSFDLVAGSDPYNNQIKLSWSTTNENNIAYYLVMEGPDSTSLAYLAHVNNQGSGTGRIDYDFIHHAPAANELHYYQIVTVLKDSTRRYSATVSTAYGITGMISRSEWEFTEVSSTAATRDRLMQSLQMADFSPVGLRAEAGVPLVINVDPVNAAALPQLIVGTYDRQSVSTYNLRAGLNTINNPNGGDLYIRYSADNPTPSNRVRIRFQSGFKQIPLYVLGSTTHQQWLDQLTMDTASPNVTLIANRVFIVTSRQKAQQYEAANQDTLLTYMDEIMRVEDQISGLDNSSPVHAPAYGNKLMLLEKASGNPDATSLGRVRIPSGSVNWILDPAYIATGEGGWGIYHEIGHHHQQYPWSWSACTEVTVNIYSMAAKRFFHPGSTGMASSDWDLAMAYLMDTSSTKNYNKSANYVKLGLWNQLGMAFGDSFYQAIHKRTREERTVPVGDSAEIRLMMLYASETSGKDLRSFFRKWNLPVDTAVYAEIAALGLPAPATDPAVLREDWAVSLNRGGDPDNVDAVILNGSAFGPEGIKSVEIYADGVKISTLTSRPFNFVWENVPAGSHTLVLKAVGVSDTVVSSAPLVILQRAVSLIYPEDNASITAGNDILLQAATAPGTSVSNVEFYANGSKIGESATAPYQCNWSAPINNIYDLEAKVNYVGGGSDFSSAVGVNVGGYFPVADGYVRDAGNANVNYGHDTILVVKKDGSGYNRISLLKFDPGNFPGASDSLALFLHINAANSSVSKTKWQLWLCNNSTWQEDDLNWNNQPTTDSLLGTIDTKSSGTVSWRINGDIHGLLAADGSLTLAVVSTTVNGTSDASFYARDAAAITLRPQLMVYKDLTALGAVPVTYSPLKATLSGKQVLLRWQTFTEQNTSAFVIEHSRDGQSFVPAGTEVAVGNTTIGHRYSFLHLTPAMGLNFYRFKELSRSGAVQYSNIVVVDIKHLNDPSNWRLYPNPVNAGKEVAIALSGEIKGAVNIKVFNIAGKAVLSQTFIPHGDNIVALKTAGLRPGVYFVRILKSGDKEDKKTGSEKRLINTDQVDISGGGPIGKSAKLIIN